MKTSERNELKLQVYALKKLGFSPEGAAKMVARGAIARQIRLEKSEVQKIKVKKPAVTHLLKLKKSRPNIIATAELKPDAPHEMQKSNRLEKLIARAKADPSKLQTQTIQALNQHLVSQGKEPITKPILPRSWFRPQTLAEIGADRDARAAYMPPVASVKMPSLRDAKMSTQQIQEYRLQQALQLEAAQKG